MDTDIKKDLIFFPKVLLFKTKEKLGTKAIVKLVESKANNPDWFGTFKVIVDKNDQVFMKLEDRETTSLFAKCKIDDFPTPTIQYIADLEKCFHLKLIDHNGDNFMYVVSFFDKNDSNQFKSVLKAYFKNAKSEKQLKNVQASNVNKVDIDEKQTRYDNENDGKVIEMYLDEMKELDDIAIHGFDRLFAKFEKFYEESLKMVLEHRTDVLIKNMCASEEQAAVGADDESSKTSNENNKQRKRTVNEITIIAIDDDKENNNDQIVTKKGKIKKKTTKKTSKKEKNEEVKTEITTNKQNNGAQPMKKQRLSSETDSDNDENEAENKVKTNKKPQRAAKNKAKAKLSKNKTQQPQRITTSDLSPQSTISSVTQQQTKKQIKAPSSPRDVPKTPMQAKQRIESIYESATKTIKQEPSRPVTRANPNGKVKQTVNEFEQKIREQATASTVKATTTATSIVSKLQNSSEKAKTKTAIPRMNTSKLRSSIDKRKLRTSQAKQDIKRKSAKRVNALLKAVETNTTEITIVKHDVLPLVDQTLNIEESVKSERRITRDLLSSTIVQQHYRVNTTVKGSKYPERKLSSNFVQFLERNTPSKLTKTELEEKRKAELQLKVRKEQERLLEREKQIQEKVECSKKKREEKMKKIIESKVKRQEEELKRREEYDRIREAEEAKKRLAEEKKREEQEKQKRLAEEKRKEELITSTKIVNSYYVSSSTIASSATSSSSSTTSHNLNLLASASKPKPYLDENNKQVVHTSTKLLHLPPSGPTPVVTAAHKQKLSMKTADYEHISSSNTQSKLLTNQINVLGEKSKPIVLLNKLPSTMNAISKPLETTYVLNTPAVETIQVKNANTNSLQKKVLNNSLYNQVGINPDNYPATPLSQPKLKDADNYDVSDLRSDDETDDEEDPSKPIPEWARDVNIQRKAREQCLACYNYTKIFKSASNHEIKLDEIFRTKRKKFNERSSSANWSSPPIWHTGITGEESFRKFHK